MYNSFYLNSQMSNLSILIKLTFLVIPTLSGTVHLMTSRNSLIDISVNGAFCLSQQSVNGFQVSTIDSCYYKDGDFLEIRIQSTDSTKDSGIMAHFALSDSLGKSYNFATSANWFCNVYSAVNADQKFLNSNLNGYDPKPNWIWDSANSEKVVCYTQLNSYFYLNAKVIVDNYFDAFEVKDANGVSKYRWESSPREDPNLWNKCREVTVSLEVENGDFIYIEAGADTPNSDSVPQGGTGLNAMITIKAGLDYFNIPTSSGSSWLCADNTNQSKWGANNGGSVGVYQNAASSGFPNYCNLGASIWNWYSMFAICKHRVSNLP